MALPMALPSTRRHGSVKIIMSFVHPHFLFMHGVKIHCRVADGAEHQRQYANAVAVLPLCGANSACPLHTLQAIAMAPKSDTSTIFI